MVAGEASISSCRRLRLDERRGRMAGCAGDDEEGCASVVGSTTCAVRRMEGLLLPVASCPPASLSDMLIDTAELRLDSLSVLIFVLIALPWLLAGIKP